MVIPFLDSAHQYSNNDGAYFISSFKYYLLLTVLIFSMI